MPSHYDALFRRLFEKPEVSADFIRNYLSADYQGKIDFESATIDPNTYIDEVLRKNYTDLRRQIRSSWIRCRITI